MSTIWGQAEKRKIQTNEEKGFHSNDAWGDPEEGSSGIQDLKECFHILRAIAGKSLTGKFAIKGGSLVLKGMNS